MVRQGRDSTVVRVGGIVDLSTESALRDCLRQAMADGARCIVLDLAGVPRLDSSGLGTIVSAFKVLQQRGGQLVLVAAQPSVLTVFQLTSVDRLLPMYDSVEAAEEDLAAGAGDR